MLMSFDDWKEGKVAPATVEVPVEDTKAEKESTSGAGPRPPPRFRYPPAMPGIVGPPAKKAPGR
jgi:hypothetical protein